MRYDTHNPPKHGQPVYLADPSQAKGYRALTWYANPSRERWKQALLHGLLFSTYKQAQQASALMVSGLNAYWGDMVAAGRISEDNPIDWNNLADVWRYENQ